MKRRKGNLKKKFNLIINIRHCDRKKYVKCFLFLLYLSVYSVIQKQFPTCHDKTTQRCIG